MFLLVSPKITCGVLIDYDRGKGEFAARNF